jgi:hypothetical protein
VASSRWSIVGSFVNGRRLIDRPARLAAAGIARARPFAPFAVLQTARSVTVGGCDSDRPRIKRGTVPADTRSGPVASRTPDARGPRQGWG